MLTTEEYEKLVSEIMEKYQYPNYDIKVRFNNMLSNFAYINITKREITLSRGWFNCNGAGFAVHIIKHEVAHMKYPDHSERFKMECKRMKIRAVAAYTDEDFERLGWKKIVRAKKGTVTADMFDCLWKEESTYTYEECEELL